MTAESLTDTPSGDAAEFVAAPPQPESEGPDQTAAAADGAALTLVATGRRNAAAQWSDVYLLAYVAPSARYSLDLSTLGFDEKWQLRSGVAVGAATLRHALFSSDGSLKLPRIPGARLALLRHPWSGIAEIRLGSRSLEVDLYSETTEIVLFDPVTGVVLPSDAGEVEEYQRQSLPPPAEECTAPLPGILASVGKPADRAWAGIAPAHRPARADYAPNIGAEGTLNVWATGEKHREATDSEVILLSLEPLGYGLSVQPPPSVAGPEWIRIEPYHTPQRSYDAPLKCRRGEFRLHASPAGRLVFLTHPWSGVVEIAFNGTTIRRDLYSPSDGTLEISLADLGGNQDLNGSPEPVRLVGWESEWQRHPKRHRYLRLLSTVDPGRPLALYTPRWRGVAASTLNLFDQALPIPATPAEHPDEITAEDLTFYSRTLVSTGVQHFVVSGGDTFWLEIIRRVQALDPGVRFDVLWHSNYLQMGEEHDWNLLRHWLRALSDGAVTRVGVVKRGLERFFRGMGLDAVFVPNVIRADPAAISYAGAVRKAGIWLSGSTEYRKMPHAALLALKMLKDVRLVGSGFDQGAMEMVAELGLAYDRLWPTPLSQAALHKAIRQTGLTLYVTLSECSPMLPIESMHLGVPCLVGPTSHLFRDHDYLRRALVVMAPLSPASIHDHAQIALAEGERIIEAFRAYAQEEQEQAKLALGVLLG